MSMDHVQYGGIPYLNNNNVGWDHHSSASWEERQDTFHSPHVQRSSLEETMVEFAKTRVEMEDSKAQMAKSSLEKAMAKLRRGQADLAMAQAKSERSMADMDNFQVGLPRFHAYNEKTQPPQEKMTNLETTMAKWRRAQAEFATSQTPFIEEVNQPPQEESIFENGMDVLAISRVNLAKSRPEFFLEETKANVHIQPIPLKSLEEAMTPKAISHTQSNMKIEQNPHRKEMSIRELMAQHMNEEKKRAKMSSKAQ